MHVLAHSASVAIGAGIVGTTIHSEWAFLIIAGILLHFAQALVDWNK